MDIHFEKCQNNGVDAADALQLDVRTKNIPIIFFTNADIEELTQRAKNSLRVSVFLLKLNTSQVRYCQKSRGCTMSF